MNDEIIFADDFTALDTKNMSQYCTHALCHSGEMMFCLAGKSFRMTPGDCIIFVHNELITDIQTTDDFHATVIYISYPFLYKNIPRNDYDINGKLTLLQNPVMPLNEAGQKTFLADVALISTRLECVSHHFYHEMIGCYVEAFVLDLYDFHAQLYGYSSVSKQSADIMNRFIGLLRSGQYKITIVYHSQIPYRSKQESEWLSCEFLDRPVYHYRDNPVAIRQDPDLKGDFGENEFCISLLFLSICNAYLESDPFCI